jgi:hypothetical protein
MVEVMVASACFFRVCIAMVEVMVEVVVETMF